MHCIDNALNYCSVENSQEFASSENAFGKPWHGFGCGVPILSTVKSRAVQRSTIQFLTLMLLIETLRYTKLGRLLPKSDQIKRKIIADRNWAHFYRIKGLKKC